jgi:integrative and conjugative element protein (TIGR02256 family)
MAKWRAMNRKASGREGKELEGKRNAVDVERCDESVDAFNAQEKEDSYLESSLVFERAQGGRFYIGQEVLARMRPFVQDAPEKLEAGGLLMGRYLLESRDVVVDAITVPEPGDKRSRHRFYRAHGRHQARLERAWEESAHTCTYLGEWHTHPEQNPTPSPIDRANWIRKLRTDDFGSHLFFLILGTETAGLWEGRRRRMTLRRSL